MNFSIEVPVYKTKYLEETIRSVLKQQYSDWHLYILWDKALLGAPPNKTPYTHPKITFLHRSNKGIAQSRRLLSNFSTSDIILPLDDDDRLLPNTLKQFAGFANKYKGFGIIRARREFIDSAGVKLKQACWFPFEQRQQYKGMTIDIHNHSQPYIINRKSYLKTKGWEGYSKFKGAGEDCDIFLKIEEIAPILLLDSVLYQYRLHDTRHSLELKEQGAFEIWKKLARKTIKRRGLKLDIISDSLPFYYIDRQ